MARLRRIVVYFGVLITILSVFVPMISFDGNSYGLMDNGFSSQIMGALIIVFAALVLIFMTLKKYKLMFIPTVVDIILIIISISQIYKIDGISLVEYKREIANILFPIGIIITIFGEVMLIFSGKIDKISKKHKEEKLIEKAIDNLGENDSDSNELLVASDSDFEEDFSGEQIPIESLNKNIAGKNFEPEVIDDVNINVTNENLLFDNEVHEDLINTSLNESSDKEEKNNVVDNVSNSIVENSHDKINNDNVVENYNSKVDSSSSIVENDGNDLNDSNFTTSEPSINVNYSIASPNVDYNNDEFEPKNVEITNLYDDDDDIEFLPDLDDDFEDEDIDFEDVENSNLAYEDFSNQSNSNNYSDIPDVKEENYMINNVQKVDEVAPQYMAINPSDRKIDIKEEKIEKSTVDFSKRNITRLKNRFCSFCQTPLGDDERICPECGRIN